MSKKHLFLFLFLVFPLVSFAAPFERDLYFGMRNKADVRELQNFLTEQGVYREEITGNFFAITREAVRRFQEKEGIIPAAGYFGSKTRAIANGKKNESLAGDRVKTIAFLTQRIQTLQEELKRLQQSLTPPSAPEPLPAPASVIVTSSSTPPSSATATPLIVTASPVVAGVKFGGESTTTFPASVILTEPFKIGDIVIRNDTNEPLLFSQLVFDIYDAMNSTLNRGREISLFLRQGSTTSDTLISKTKFSFSSSTPPVFDGMHRYQVKTEYPILFAAGETKSAGFWTENLDYVIGGTLKFALYDIETTRAVNRFHGFSFLLTR